MSIAPSIHCISTSFAFNIERLWPIQSYGYVISRTTRLYGAVELGLPLSRIIDDGAPVLRGYSTYRVVYWPYPHSIVGEHQYYIVMDQWRQWWWRRWLISMSVLPVLYQTDSAKLCAYDVNNWNNSKNMNRWTNYHGNLFFSIIRVDSNSTLLLYLIMFYASA